MSSPANPAGEAGGTGRHGAGTPPTRAQLRAVTGAGPAGEVRAAATTVRGLVRRGLAAPHGRRGAHYLTAAGRELRDRLGQEAPPPAAAPGTDTFAPATGDGPAAEGAGEHARGAARAWEALREIRRVTGAESPATGPVPAEWERARPVHAVALALQAAGAVPSAVAPGGRRVRTGYRVVPGPVPGTARVEWRTAAGEAAEDGDRTAQARRNLTLCAETLAARGWETERYLASGGRPFLLVAPLGSV